MLRVLVQKGHVYPREPGFESGTGTYKEQEFVTLVGDELAGLLERDGRFEPIVVPGDIPDGIKVDAALFLHGDGSANPSSSGYCFGYPMYAVNKALAELIAKEFDAIPGYPRHRMDNYTRNLSRYYGFSRVDTAGPEVLVEHGFLTNPGERLFLFGHVKEIAAAEYRALCAYFGFKPRDGKPVSPEDPHNFWTWARWWRGHGEFAPFGPRNPGVRPNVPKNITLQRPHWWARLAANIGRR